LKIAIIGTKGIPNSYGGFEAFAENISVKLSSLGFDVTVYQPHSKSVLLEPYRSVVRFGVRIISWLPKNLQRVQYNLFSLRLVKQHNHQVIICCGHSPSIFFPFFSKPFRNKLVVNMDGLEWKRQKWGVLARTMLLISERLAVRYTNSLVADSKAVQQYIWDKYRRKSNYIPYGAVEGSPGANQNVLQVLGLKPMDYGLLIARIEPENMVKQAINAFVSLTKMLVVVGGLDNGYAKKLKQLFEHNRNVVFAGALYELSSLNCLRKNSRVYIHGHSVGGTNPSLLDAMAGGCVIIANDNPFNRETMGAGGYYFTSIDDLPSRIEMAWNIDEDERKALNSMNTSRIMEQYTWDIVVDSYIKVIKRVAYD
jgi:glycosyltransferase involved in cell wall biosynthesis